MLTVIKNGKFTGTRYNEDLTKYREFHANQGELCIWTEDSIIESIETDDDSFETITYKTISDAELLGYVIESKKKEITNYRDSLIESGMVYTFPDGTDGTVQLDSKSISNLYGVATSATIINSLGTDDVIQFRDLEDITHELSANETLVFCATVLAYCSSCFSVAWDHKDAVKVLTDVDSINDYDYSSNWPVN